MYWNSFPCPAHIFFHPHEKLQIASSYDADLEYLIWAFCHYLFLSYTDKIHIQRSNAKNMISELREPQNMYVRQNVNFENLTPKQYIMHHAWARKCNHS